MKNKKIVLKKVYSEDEVNEIVKDVIDDFNTRKLERRPFELNWQLNINFLLGNQFSYITNSGDIENSEKQYFWQQREVFNHIAPLVETRLAKLSRVRPSMTVVPSSDDDKDVYSAKLSKNIIKALQHRTNVNQILTEGTKWSEICGTAFYKVFWNGKSGSKLGVDESGDTIYSGDVEISAIPPYEIYPKTMSCETIEGQTSIIHARAIPVEQIKATWGVEVDPEDIDVLSLENVSSSGGLGYSTASMAATKQTKKGHAVVIERYEAPTSEFKNGRLIIVCANKLLHIGELPYKNLQDEKRGFPFIKQVSIEQTNCFFGISMIDRVIPIQRAYNAVKNRKHEFLNRLAMGVLTIEDGSVDVENIEDEGLSPGKILVYRQGSTPPQFMQAGSVPSDLSSEEDRLLNEFQLISGVSDLMRNSKVLNSSNMSGVALQLLIEQDDSRLAGSSDQIKFAVLEMAKQSIRLYKQFATLPRLEKITNAGGEVELIYFKASDISSDDVVFETESEISETLAQKRTMVMDLLNAGLLSDENGKLSNRMRAKALELLGFGLWETAQDTSTLHIRRADKENLDILENKKVEVDEFDDHAIHITQHINYLISGVLDGKNINKNAKENLKQHIREHKKFEEIEKEISDIGEK